MKLLDNPLSLEDQENIIRILDGDICRIVSSDDVSGVMDGLAFAWVRISMLAYSRIMEIDSRKKAD